MSVDDEITPNVRQFMPNAHSNGVSTSVSNVRMHMTKGTGASKEVTTKNGNGYLHEQE